MNYRHAYHAGSFSDVFKHLVLTALIQSLQRKETPFCYLDTHAGSGLYDLSSSIAQKTKEYEMGIEKLKNKKEAPLLIQDFLKIVDTLNSKGTHYYPGSPYLAKQLLRPEDRMVLCELHSDDVLNLKKLFRNDAQISIHHQDGYLGLKAFLPPPERCNEGTGGACVTMRCGSTARICTHVRPADDGEAHGQAAGRQAVDLRSEVGWISGAAAEEQRSRPHPLA